MKLPLPFIGRRIEMVKLRRLHARGAHVLVVGPEGVGKSAMVNHLRKSLPLVICGNSESLGEICRNLEMDLNSTAPRLPLVQRKNRLLKMLAETGQTVVFDGVSWTTPRISSFLERVMELGPVWICARSELARDIGHFWPLLARLATVKLRPFHFSETSAVLGAAIESGQIPPSVEPFARSLHQLARGLPLTLCELLEQFAAGHYDLSRRAGWQLLETDRRIKKLPPLVA
jgi:energy-coupling factor transporter ATP-binding protein EcfA2